MRVDAQPAFILHARPYRETSLLLECLTRDHGRIGLVARGVRRERSRLPRGLLQPLQPLALGWTGGGDLAPLVAAEATAVPYVLAGSRLFSAIYLNELVLRLSVRADPHAGLFEHYHDCLRRLAGAEGEAWTLRRFERDLLAGLGYALVLDHAFDTGDPLEEDVAYAYVPDAGPVTWREQPGAVRVRGAALLALARDEAPGSDDLAALRRLMRSLVRHQLGGGELKAWSMRLAPETSRR